MSTQLDDLKKEIKALADAKKAKIMRRFFKTEEGQYGFGDEFYGLSVPQTRTISKKYHLDFEEIRELLASKIHEERLCALLILVRKFKHGKENKKTYDFYLNNSTKVNNWDLVDLSADKIVGEYLFENEGQKGILEKFAKSGNLWHRRIAIISTFAFIKRNQFSKTLEISKMLLEDKHDLIQKSVGWMLREIGKRDQKTEEKFLLKYHKQMPRTMLRYAIEKFTDKKRKYYMSK